MKMDVHFSSATDDWETPQDLFNGISDEFGGFDLDVCASSKNNKVINFFSKEQDSLSKEWMGKCWMNPPYGREIGKWMAKAFKSCHENKATVVCLVPARTDTAWWHEYAMRGEVRFLRGRLKFGGHRNPAPFPSAIIVFKPINDSKGDQTTRTEIGD